MTRNAVRATIRGVGAWSNAVRLRCPYTWPALQGIDSWGDAKSVLPQPALSYRIRHFTWLHTIPKPRTDVLGMYAMQQRSYVGA